mgnify:CR=1 FL=1
MRLFGYGAAIAVGGMLAARILWLRRNKAGLSDETFWAFLNGLLIAGFVGGHILYLLEYARPGTEAFGRAVFSLSGGYSVYGGFIAVIAFVAAFARWKKISFMRLADNVFWCAAFWHVWGRFGCFLAGCCYGTPTDFPLSVTFRDVRALVPSSLLGVPLHPTQLYEMAGDVLIAAALWRVLRATDAGRWSPGLVAAGYLAAYGCLRFAVEFVRGDTLPLFGFLTAGQALSLLMLAVSGAILAGRSRCIQSC